MRELNIQLHDVLIHAAERWADRVAVVHRGERLTFGEVEARSNSLANALVARNIERGDRVVIFAENSVETIVSFWGALKANAVPVVVHPQTKADKLAYLLRDSGATAFVGQTKLARVFEAVVRESGTLRVSVVEGGMEPERLAGLPGGVRWEEAMAAEGCRPPPRLNHELDLASIIYTSGSTGEPKGVMLTHRNMIAAATSVGGYLGMREDDVTIVVLPLAFDYGLYQVILSARAGGRVVLEPSFAFPTRVLELMVEERVTVLPGVPTIFATIAGMSHLGELDLSSIRMITNTAAALSPGQIGRLRELFPQARVFSMYGLTECKRCTYLPPEMLDEKPGSVGIAIPNTEMWIVDAAGQRVGPNTVGELVIRGATVMRGYWNKPEATARKLRPGPLPGEMVLHTGDFCRMDEDGFLYFVGRADDVIKSRGEKVAPQAVENVLSDLPEIREVAVVGVDDEILGQAVKAFVVLAEGVEVDEKWVQRECQRRLESFMVPKFVEFRSELPKGPTGKILKKELAAC